VTDCQDMISTSFYQSSVCLCVCTAKKGILRDKRDFWAVLQQVEKHASDAVDITTSVREMPHIKYVVYNFIFNLI